MIMPNEFLGAEEAKEILADAERGFLNFLGQHNRRVAVTAAKHSFSYVCDLRPLGLRDDESQAVQDEINYRWVFMCRIVIRRNARHCKN